jgi:hypothetical protein
MIGEGGGGRRREEGGRREGGGRRKEEGEGRTEGGGRKEEGGEKREGRGGEGGPSFGWPWCLASSSTSWRSARPTENVPTPGDNHLKKKLGRKRKGGGRGRKKEASGGEPGKECNPALTSPKMLFILHRKNLP